MSQAQLKREIDTLARDLLNIDLQIQQIKQGGHNPHQLQTLEAAKLEIQKQVLSKEIELQQKKAQGKRGHR